ncbi:5E5 antigen-like [Canis lupus dingo]|uniref:5E5 antigen-like n=1 Tax=Canis lupus dingo TaxID=286419 RepID=UPI0020C405CC|nr:5E5 antigen-like [Canis lupus dingo]
MAEPPAKVTRSRPPRQPRRRRQLRRLQGQIRSAGPKGSSRHPLRAPTALSPPPGGGGWEASPSPPPPHRAQKDELARGEKGRGLRLSGVGNQRARARRPATSSGPEPAVRGAGTAAPRALFSPQSLLRCRGSEKPRGQWRRTRLGHQLFKLGREREVGRGLACRTPERAWTGKVTPAPISAPGDVHLREGKRKGGPSGGGFFGSSRLPATGRGGAPVGKEVERERVRAGIADDLPSEPKDVLSPGLTPLLASSARVCATPLAAGLAPQSAPGRNRFPSSASSRPLRSTPSTSLPPSGPHSRASTGGGVFLGTTCMRLHTGPQALGAATDPPPRTAPGSRLPAPGSRLPARRTLAAQPAPPRLAARSAALRCGLQRQAPLASGP